METIPRAEDAAKRPSEADVAHDCSNCGEPAVKKYCPECGQEATHFLLPVRHLARECAVEFFNFDARLVRSFRLLLTRPGFLPGEYVAGKRARYLSPLRLCVTLSALAVWLSSHVGDTGLDTSFNLFLSFVPLLALTLAGLSGAQSVCTWST